MSQVVLEQYEQAPEPYDPLADHPDPVRLTLDSLKQGTIMAGREKPFVWELDQYTSEGAMHTYRAKAEIEALINLAECGPDDIELEISEDEKATLRSLYHHDNFDPEAVG